MCVMLCCAAACGGRLPSTGIKLSTLWDVMTAVHVLSLQVDSLSKMWDHASKVTNPFDSSTTTGKPGQTSSAYVASTTKSANTASTSTYSGSSHSLLLDKPAPGAPADKPQTVEDVQGGQIAWLLIRGWKLTSCPALDVLLHRMCSCNSLAIQA